MVNLNNTLWDKKLESLLLKYDAEVQEIEELYESVVKRNIKCWLAAFSAFSTLAIFAILDDQMFAAFALLCYAACSTLEILNILDEADQL